jgi:hypothetical protein
MASSPSKMAWAHLAVRCQPVKNGMPAVLILILIVFFVNGKMDKGSFLT